MTPRKTRPAPAREDGPLAPAPDPLRDHIAVRALELLIGADPREFLRQMTMPDPAPATSLANVARLSYAIADAMLEARRG